MKRIILKYGYWCTCLFILLIGCDKDEKDVYATKEDSIDWYAVPDLTGEFNEIRYDIYKASDITVLVQDTLGAVQVGTDVYGNPIIHTEVFDLGYNVTGSLLRDFKIVRSKDTSAMIKGMQAVQKHVLPYLPANRENRPRVIFMLDSVYYVNPGNANQMGDRLIYNNCIAGVGIGHIDRLKTFDVDSEEWRYWAANILAWKTASWIADHCLVDYQSFVDQTPKYGFNNQSYYNYTGPKGSVDCRNASFLKWGKCYHDIIVQPNNWTEAGPTQKEDLQEYVAHIYQYRGREEIFEANYNAYPIILQKFKLARKMVEEYFEQHGLQL